MANTADKDVESNKVIAAVGYVWILCLVPLFLKRHSKFAQFHAKQGLVLFIVEVIGWLIFWIPIERNPIQPRARTVFTEVKRFATLATG